MAWSGGSVASEPGFAFSAAMKAKGGTWTVDALNKWIEQSARRRPRHPDDVRGLKNEKQRADVIAYLNSLSDSPKPLPTAAANQAGGRPDIGPDMDRL